MVQSGRVNRLGFMGGDRLGSYEVFRDMLVQQLNLFSLRSSIWQHGRGGMIQRLRELVPDVSRQENTETLAFNDYWELKRRHLQDFQCQLMLNALSSIPSKSLTVVDIGDSAGTHFIYLKNLMPPDRRIRTLSVNLDSRAIEKIRARGLEAIHCRAEELSLEHPVDLFMSFEMLEHLHNPALFLHRLAKRPDKSRLLLTVPFLRRSRVGLHYTRRESLDLIHAEDEHIFELCPADWTLLFRHSGWKVSWSRICLQYPDWPLVGSVLGRWWRRVDYEGFWGVLLEKDPALSDRYLDWEI